MVREKKFRIITWGICFRTVSYMVLSSILQLIFIIDNRLDWQQSAVLLCRALNRTSKTEHQFTDYMETDSFRLKKYAVS